MDAILNIASCMSYTIAKAPIWGIDHVVLGLIQIILYALDFLAFSAAVGWMALDGVALLLDTGYDAVTMTSSAAPTIVAAIWTTISSPKEFASLVQNFQKPVTASIPYLTFSTIDIVENLFTVTASIFKALIIARALPLAINAFTLCFSSAIASARSAEWRRTARRNVLAFGFPIAKAPIWGIDHVVLALIQIILYALGFLAFSVAVGWMALDGVALLLDTGYDAVTMTSSAAPSIVAASWTTLSSPKEFASLVRKFQKTVTASIPYLLFSVIDVVENLSRVAALIFKALILTRALPLATNAFTPCFSSAPARSAEWRRTAKRNVLAFGFPVLLATCCLLALISQTSPIPTERRTASGVLSREPGALSNLTGMLLSSDSFNFGRNVVINHTHMNLRFEDEMSGWSIPTLLLDNASN